MCLSRFIIFVSVASYLKSIGLLSSVINHAWTFNQGAGSIFQRVEHQIFEKAIEKGEGKFIDDFNRDYSFGTLVWPLGNANVSGNMNVDVTSYGDLLIISSEVSYNFVDYFRIEFLNSETEGQGTQKPHDRSVTPMLGTVAFYIRDNWRTKIDAVIKKRKGA
jgi:hypothetical protein